MRPTIYYIRQLALVCAIAFVVGALIWSLT